MISCKQLGVQESKEASYRHANAWWQAKRAEIDGRPLPHSEPELLAELTRRRDWARQNNHPELVEEYNRRIDLSDRTDDPSSLLLPPNVERRLEGLRTLGVKLPAGLDPHALNAILGEGRVWGERYHRAPEPTPADRTVGFHVDRYMSYQLSRQRAEQISISDYAQTRQALEAFRTWIGSETSIDSIHADKWEEWYLGLLNLKLAKDTKRNRLRRAREFVSWLGEKGLLAIPGNLHSRKFRFKGAQANIITFTEDEVKTLIGESPGQLKLHIMLALNCAFYPVDISDLTHDEVVWQTGRIIRKRSKTHDKEAVPTVEYPLWTATFDLLRRYASKEGTRVLMTESGREWVRNSLDEDGKPHRVNAVQSNYIHVKKRLGLRKPFKSLRATAASKLEQHGEFARYSQHFLGQAPTDIARKHYVRPSQDRFDAAVKWIGEQYGF